MRRARRRGASRDYGTILLGSAGERGLKQRIRIQTLLTSFIVLANLIGVLLAVVLASVGIPEPDIFQADLWWVNFIAIPIYLVVAFLVGISLGTFVVVRDLRWAIEDRVPTDKDVKRFRRAPRRLVMVQALLWGTGTVMFTIMYGVIDPNIIPKAAFVIGMSGIVVIAFSQLLIELALRPVAADVINAGYRRRKRSGVRARSVVSWMVGSGIPIVGIILVVSFGAFRGDTSKTDLFVGVTVLGLIALFTGSLLTVLSSQSVTAPIRSVRRAMDRVQRGHIDDDVEVVVYDGTELGDLQFGFNTMLNGLRERDKMRDVFGRHVGRDVAEAALARDPELGGVERTVAALFVDVIGSTTFAAERSPTDVVATLNRFFGVIVRAIEDRRGLVNKFEGDAVLAVFGAPIDLADAAGAALSAAREIAQNLVREVPELAAGIGVGYGSVVAGNVGAIERFEYTVIGDPVNESARLSEVAKRDPARPLATGRALEAASPDEACKWELLEASTLRGRTADTVIYGAIGLGGAVDDPADDADGVTTESTTRDDDVTPGYPQILR